ncbi:MAG: cell envelope integrity protein TolA [SAR324 cluster bacterium]|nr:cell envelope integrity protein TolA [SAR324 cluster bacterium]
MFDNQCAENEKMCHAGLDPASRGTKTNVSCLELVYIVQTTFPMKEAFMTRTLFNWSRHQTLMALLVGMAVFLGFPSSSAWALDDAEEQFFGMGLGNAGNLEQQEIEDYLGKAKKAAEQENFEEAETWMNKAKKFKNAALKKRIQQTEQAIAKAQQTKQRREEAAADRRRQEESARQAQSAGGGSRQQQGPEVDSVIVKGDIYRGFGSSYLDEKLTVSGGPTNCYVDIKSSGNSDTVFLYRGNCASLAGVYNFSLYAENGRVACSGTIRLSGKKSRYEIRLNSDCRDFGSFEN